MSLTVGTRLGHYDVTALIGEGGMGQVWQATDTQLGRQVALKIVPDAFAADPDRLARFQREAQVLTSLNHPNIAAIHGIEEAESTRALVLELVEGPTLADRIARGPIPVDEALPIAKQIAEALEAAHEAGVIHRDLKPANIKVREDGTVKVLDFGLAKALGGDVGGDPAESPTLTAAATKMGVIVGTAAYMSPEQASGETTDKRSDIWSFGVVLFEMLTGRTTAKLYSSLSRASDPGTEPGHVPHVKGRVTMRKLTTLVATMVFLGTVALVPGRALAGVDSFFDVFFEVDFDPNTDGPTISARGTLTTVSTVPAVRTSVPVEIIELSLVSSGGSDGSSRHEATLSYNIGSSGQDGVRGKQDKPTTAYAQLDITCLRKDPRSKTARCEVDNVRASDKHKHKGHVTILK